MNTPAHQKAPLTKTHPNRVKLAFQKERLKCSQLQKKVGQMQQEITSQGVKLDGDQLSSVMSGSSKFGKFVDAVSTIWL